ncbi:Aste57867_1319 [Aphanomyces stellatus]|uniref:Aste57867_1319 protein n=1 Tax=Aphanomyces stellatus TaxID=120398 RepID=A0A485K897_9STRA|nr:hypothetical protein As57867_001318 [Aphanomyces stellatus]VFT78538.1 Aste57867_1319 [Aphanomyces stellatus]
MKPEHLSIDDCTFSWDHTLELIDIMDIPMDEANLFSIQTYDDLEQLHLDLPSVKTSTSMQVDLQPHLYPPTPMVHHPCCRHHPHNSALLYASTEAVTMVDLLSLDPVPPLSSQPISINPSTRRSVTTTSTISRGTCLHTDCTNTIPWPRGLCKQHGKKQKCGHAMCPRGTQKGGYCFRHGGGDRCSVARCSNAAQTRGLCKKHGGSTRCTFAGCTKTSQGHKLCREHGGGKRCQAPGCHKGVQRSGFCASHLTKRRASDDGRITSTCAVGGCPQSATPGSHLCHRHGANIRRITRPATESENEDGMTSGDDSSSVGSVDEYLI